MTPLSDKLIKLFPLDIIKEKKKSHVSPFVFRGNVVPAGNTDFI